MASGIVEPSSQDSQDSQEQNQTPRSGERAKLVERLLDAPNLPAFLTDLVTAQAVTVVGTEGVGFILERNQQQINLRPVAHIRPDGSDEKVRAQAQQAFVELIKPCITQGKDGALEVGQANADNESQYCLVTLLRTETEIVAVSAVITRCRNPERARQRLMSMQLVAGYFELYNLRRHSDANRAIAHSHQRVLQLSRAVADADGFLSAAMNLCNELATASGATRVSLGWLKGRIIKVKALSHTEEFDKKQELIVQLEKAMEECYDQETLVLYDPSGATGGDAVTRQAAALSRGQGGHIVLLLPLRRHADIEGVVCLEFLSTVQLGPKVMEDLSLAVDLLAPQLFDRHANDRWLITKAGLSIQHVLEETLGPKYWIPKLITFGVIAIILIITNFFNVLIPLHVDIRPTYSVSAPFTFAAVEKRSLSAPYDGYIHDVFKKPGDVVKAGEPLLKMDTTELELKRAQAQSDALSHQREAEKNRYDTTSNKQAEYKVAMAQHDESQAQANLYQWQIEHATIIAPTDGEVLKSSVEDKIGSPVKQGDELMLVAQQGNLRAEINANERDIQDLKPGQTGKLATTSLPTEKYPFTVERIIPLGQAKEGNNVFTIYAQLDKVSPSWLPGMQGEVRVDVGKRTWAWMWTHRLIDFIRLKIWM
jgi:RND family efflux transporter MFP subunit